VHLPVNRAVKLTMASEDVIHSFYVPAFRIKQDVIPGRFTTEWFQPSQVGTYHFYCSEYCGVNHSKMDGNVIVMTAADYQDWLAHGRTSETLAQSGESLFRTLGCSGCHAPTAAVHAPPMEGLYENTVPLNDGTFVRADDKYLRDSILIPSAQIVAGYSSSMPAYAGHIREEELLQLIAYIRSLAKETPPHLP
jgi:cytochrome c oxidase subunit 2